VGGEAQYDDVTIVTIGFSGVIEAKDNGGADLTLRVVPVR
jgi:hypothetical protein